MCLSATVFLKRYFSQVGRRLLIRRTLTKITQPPLPPATYLILLPELDFHGEMRARFQAVQLAPRFLSLRVEQGRV